MANLVVPQGEGSSSKSAWRKAVGQVLSHVDQKSIADQSAKATEKLTSLPVYKQAQNISIFLAMPKGEQQTEGIVRHALNSGKNVFVPFIKRKPPSMDMLQLQDESDFNSLKPDKWGIPSLDAETVENRVNCFGYRGVGEPEEGIRPYDADVGLDLIILPCVAFDQDYNRLGHGKGYYDRFLTRYFGKLSPDGNAYRKPYLIGLGLAEQFLPDPHRLPIESWDHKVDALLLGDRFVARVPLASHASS
ncbi:5-formyltetrahydrofolate cyclo-ligase-like protein [Elsinoe fawcettii]|nr:5-formyltetrahydrofolate cyclo-ligase-like protein [Elsinoe fawcettii]